MVTQIFEEIGFHKYYEFIKEKKIIPQTMIIVIGSLISGFIKKVIKDFVYPLGKGQIEKIKKNFKAAMKSYPILGINIIVTSYVLFVLSSLVD